MSITLHDDVSPMQEGLRELPMLSVVSNCVSGLGAAQHNSAGTFATLGLSRMPPGRCRVARHEWLRSSGT